jgi:hypothetical protein
MSFPEKKRRSFSLLSLLNRKPEGADFHEEDEKAGSSGNLGSEGTPGQPQPI